MNTVNRIITLSLRQRANRKYMMKNFLILRKRGKRLFLL